MQFLLQKHPRNKVLTTKTVLEGITCVADLGLSVIALAIRPTPVPELVCITFQSQIIGFAISQDPMLGSFHLYRIGYQVLLHFHPFALDQQENLRASQAKTNH